MAKNNIDNLKKKLVEDGFLHVYEWQDQPGTVYPPHAHKDRVSFYITKGGLRFNFGTETIEVNEGERFDVPVGKEHSAVAGSKGCSFVVGEMIEGDS